jgi:hypothetical protein
MSEYKHNIDLLRKILENLGNPDELNNHPWVNSRMVAETCARNPGIRTQPPGKQLVHTLSIIFRKMMPTTSPRRGIRLDTHWGEFGLLAAQYFVPYYFDLPYPASLKEAWQGIDKAILLFVFNSDTNISEEDRDRYQLIGNEPEVAPNSTISDWHRKGLEKLTKLVIQHENYLEYNPEIEKQGKFTKFFQFINKMKPTRLAWLWISRTALTIFIGLLIFGAWKGWQFYQRVSSLKQQAEEILVIYRSSPDLDKVHEITQRVSRLRMDLESLQVDTLPIVNMSKYLKWVPVYGGDISQAPFVLEMVVQMSVSGDEVLKAVTPLLSENLDSGSSAGILDQISKLKDADKELLAAQVAFANVQAARQKIQTDILSPSLYQLINKYFDPLIYSLNTAFPITDVLQMARLAPRLLGAVDNGKQSYMILVQNEDELRPTGGFLTAVGLMEVENGKIINLSFESSEMIDDLSKPYPKSPWQLNDYMMAEILLFRDSNWFTDFPTTVEWAKFLYAYTRSKELDGVITVDQHVIEELLKIIGPINVIGVEEPISSDNVLTFMRSAKENISPTGISWKEWDRKQFISWLADPLINKLLSGSSQNWKLLSQLLIQLLDEKHILLQFNDPEMNALLADRGWDGAVKTNPNSDFLMVVDSNVGFNKTNAKMKTEIEYTIDLVNPKSPSASLIVSLTNNSQVNPETSADCIQFGGSISDLPLDQRDYIMDDCYWTYLRVYSPAQSQLIASTPHEIPRNWPLREKLIPARTDLLDENIIGTQAFGTLLVVPRGQTMQTNFSYHLPLMVISTEPDGKTFKYSLKIQKQPGTLAVPLTFHLVLPPGMTIVNAPSDLLRAQQGLDEWVLKINLNTDVLFEISYQPVQ